MNDDRYLLGGTKNGTANALLGFGGYDYYGPDPTKSRNISESYDGSTWTNAPNMPAPAGRNFGTGTQTAALSAGGLAPPVTDLNATVEYNGSTWSSSNPLAVARGEGATFGTQTSAVAVAGDAYAPGPAYGVKDNVEEYDGTSWTAGTSTPSLVRQKGGAGTLTAGIAWAGQVSPDGTYPALVVTNETLLYDGTTWTTGGNFNNGTPGGGGAGGGTQTTTWAAGMPNAGHEQYNGTIWATAPSTSLTAGGRAGGGVQTSAVIFAGYSGGTITSTEEFTGETSALNIKTLTTS